MLALERTPAAGAPPVSPGDALSRSISTGGRLEGDPGGRTIRSAVPNANRSSTALLPS